MRVCTVDGCSTIHFCKGYCPLHYNAWKAHGDPLVRKRFDIPASTKGLEKCGVPECDAPTLSRGMCARHYQRHLKHGDALAGGMMRHRNVGACSIEGCDRRARNRGWCNMHHMRYLRHGDPLLTSTHPRSEPNPPKPQRYLLVYRPDHPNASKRGQILEHVLIMSESLGRPLLRHENVHHKNGDRRDNRLVKGHELHCPGVCCNLELWERSQPMAQRARDKVAWAKEILRLYAPECLA